MRHKDWLLPAAGIVIVLLCALIVGGAYGISRDDGYTAPPDYVPMPDYIPEVPQQPIQLPPCSQTTPWGTTFDPCGGMPEAWVNTVWKQLLGFAYFNKWKAANPNEWAALNAYLRNGQTPSNSVSPAPKSLFGSVVLFVINGCKQYVNNPAACQSAP